MLATAERRLAEVPPLLDAHSKPSSRRCINSPFTLYGLGFRMGPAEPNTRILASIVILSRGIGLSGNLRLRCQGWLRCRIGKASFLQQEAQKQGLRIGVILLGSPKTNRKELR